MNIIAPSDHLAAAAETDDVPVPAGLAGRLDSLVPCLLVVLFGCALSIGAYFSSDRSYREMQVLRFEQLANGRFADIERSIDGTLGVLRSLVGLYAASQKVERHEFRSFIDGLGVPRAVQALEWIPRVPLAQRGAVEGAAKRQGPSDFTFTERDAQGELVPAGVRDEYFPVYFLEPYEGNESAYGFDLASSATRLEALNRSTVGGKLIATSRITLVQETGDQYGFLVFAPVYRNGSPKETPDERRANLQGFALGVFRIGDLVLDALGDLVRTATPVNFEIYDLSAPEGSRRLFPKLSGPEPKLAGAPSLRADRELDVGGRRWSIIAAPTAAFGKTVPFFWRPWSVLSVGLLFTALAALYLKHIMSRALVIQQLVAARTAKLTREIAWRKRAQEELNLRAAELARSNADLEQFASVASHDLQEPLRKVQAFGERLQGRYAAKLDEQGQDYLTRMRGATARMQDLIHDLLSFSRVATQGQPFVRIDLNQVASEVITDLELPIQESGAEVALATLPSIDADSMQLRQLLQNLIGNALKYRREDVAPKIRVEGEICAPPPAEPGRPAMEVCRIRVTDNGIGFEQQYADRIFGIFQRLHGRSAYDGTGVGLAICRKIVERHGGGITAEGRPGEGACFTVTLPVDQARNMTFSEDYAKEG